MLCWQETGTNKLLLLQLTIFEVNYEAFVHIVCITDFLWWFLRITDNWISPLITNALAEDLLSPAHTLLRSRKAAAVVATAFTETAVTIPTSSAAVASSDETAATALVVGAADDILSAAVVATAIADVVAAVYEFSAAVLWATYDFSARAAAAFMPYCLWK